MRDVDKKYYSFTNDLFSGLGNFVFFLGSQWNSASQH